MKELIVLVLKIILIVVAFIAVMWILPLFMSFAFVVIGGPNHV